MQDASCFGDLALDITGVAHLFGGEAQMLTTLTKRLRQLGYTVAGAIADTLGAAWALACFRPNSIIGTDATAEALAELPVAGLRLDDAQVAGLNMMGLKTIGQLYGRDRRGLQARFGASLLLRLDQALGELTERLTPRIPIAEYAAEQRFAEPIGYIDDVLMCTRDLSIRLALRLEAESLGAQTFHLFLYRVDHKVMTLSVNAARATRDPEHITDLFLHRYERLENEYDSGFGIDMIRLAASSTSELASTQLGAFEIHDGAADLDRLYDRMTSRLGPLAVTRSRLVDTHVPEQAVCLEPMVAANDDAPFDFSRVASRPLRLLPTPEPITVTAEVPDGPPVTMVWRRVNYYIVQASTADRIGIDWWALPEPVPSTHNNPGDEAESAAAHYEDAAVTRDYFVIEDETGNRFWVFREGLYASGITPRWFMHGLYA
jgi:protein ImuB